MLQGGGSGYDAAASVWGGYGLFRGGASPRFECLELPFQPAIALWHNDRSVRTPGAVRRYLSWRAGRPEAARFFLERSNRIVARLRSAPDWERFTDALAEASELGIELGAAIGVPARLDAGTHARLLSASPEGAVFRSAGAGDELAVLLSPTAAGPWGEPAAPRPPWRTHRVNREGLSWR
jgi:phosphomevalonate kinase